MRRCRLLRAAGVVAALAGVLVGVGGSSVSADAPTREGWWSRWQTPDLSGGVALPVTVPPPPTPAGEGGLTIAADARGPEAVAALYFEVPLGADATLKLRNAGGRELALPPDATFTACTATTEWEGEMNGPWSRVPEWSENCVLGEVTADKLAIAFELPYLLQDEVGAFDLVIVPGGHAPYIVNFAVTDEETLAAGEGTTTTTEGTTTTTTEAPVVEEPEVVTTTTIEVPGGSATFTPPTTPPATTPTSLVAIRSTTGPRAPFRLPDSRGERLMAVSLLFLMAGALWWLGGAPARSPRMLGAVAGGPASRVLHAPPSRPRGVGRFARSRTGRPPRL